MKFTEEQLVLMASVSHDRNRDNGSLMKCGYTPPRPNETCPSSACTLAPRKSGSSQLLSGGCVS